MKARFFIRTVALATLAISLFCLPSTSAGSQGRLISSSKAYPAHYIVFEMWPDGSIRPLMYRQVQLSAALETLDDQARVQRLRQPDRQVERLVITLESNEGQVLYQNVVEVPRWLRGEFHPQDLTAAQTSIDGHMFPLERPTFVARAPVIAGASLVIQDDSLMPIAEFDLGQLARSTPEVTSEFRSQYLTPVLNGDPGNRVDLLVMGDGYTATQQAKFDSDAANVIANLFGISPYAQYRNYYNTYSLFTPSAEAGADHPPYQAGCQSSSCCGDSAMLSDPLQGTFVNTAFDARYCTSNIHRLLTVKYDKVLAAAAAVPDWDQILVIVNDTTYGGAGGSFAVTSMHSSAVQIAQHEYGHSFAKLADEYENAYPGYPPCSDISGPAHCEANVTDAATRSLIKWSPWISPSTPIPTVPEFDPAFASVVGLFEGARYVATGMYRSGQHCIMQALGAPYCQVPSQAYVLKLYSGGWGVPSSGIKLIEPGSLSPLTATVTLSYPDSQVFKANVLQPIGGPPLSIQWLVNGVPEPITDTTTFTYTPAISISGTITVSLSVRDATSLVHPAMAGTLLQNDHTWTITMTVKRLMYLPLVLRSP